MYRKLLFEDLGKFQKLYEMAAAKELLTEINRETAAQRITAIISNTENGIPPSYLFYMCKVFATGVFLNEFSEEVWKSLKRIHQVVVKHDHLKDFSAIEWIEAIQLSNFLSDENIGLNQRERMHARALTSLTKIGCKHSLNSSGYSLENTSVIRAHKRAETRVQQIGGLEYLNTLLDCQKGAGYTFDGMFLHNRRTSTIGREREASVPFAYLYTLALKNISNFSRRSNKRELFLKSIRISQGLAGSFNVEPYSAYELNFQSDSFLGQAWDALIYDDLFSIPQWAPCSFEFMKNAFFESLEKLFDFEGTLASLTDDLLQAKIIGEVVSGSSLHQMHLVSEKIIESYTLPFGTLNSKVNGPITSGVRNCFLRPFFETKDSKNFIHPKAIACRAYFERLFEILRNEHLALTETKREFDRLLGAALEDVTKATFKEFSMEPSIKGKKYGSRSARREVDLLFCDDEVIIIVECKKKPLTNIAKKGDIVAYLRDLEQSFLHGFEQMLAFEKAIREKDSVKFEDGVEVSLNGRKIIRIVLNLFDHGSLQNRMMTMPLIKMLPNINIYASEDADSETKDACNKIDSRVRKIRNHLVAIQEQVENPDRFLQDMAFSTFWISIDQLYMLGKHGGGIQSGLKLISTTAQSGDFAYDIMRCLNRGDLGTALDDMAQKRNAIVLN